MNQQTPCRVGVIGTGFIATALIHVLDNSPDYDVSKVLTRRVPETCNQLKYQPKLTCSIDELIDHSDMVVECSGDPIHAALAIDKILAAKLPVVTMNTEFHVTLGSYFADKGVITEAEGDQPGSTAALYEEITRMGFKPLVLGNMKGFLNHCPTPEDMDYWSKRNGISITQTTSFTDGTKIQFEQAFVANGLNSTIAKTGMYGLAGAKDSKESRNYELLAKQLGEIAKGFDKPIADYVMAPGQPAGVFIVAEHDQAQAEALRYFKMGEGPMYVLLKPFHLCSLEMPKTMDRIRSGGPVLLNNSSNPEVSIASFAKADLKPGHVLEKPIGGYDIRGEAVLIKQHPEHVPMGILKDAVINKPIEKGAMLTWDDVDIPQSFGLDIAHKLYRG